LWLAINDLHRFALDNVASGVDRAGRAQLCDQLVKDVQLCWGIVEDSMRRDEANAILAIGRYVERADMVTRVIDVRASMLLGEPDRASADLQWAGVLRSLSALQMYQRTMNGPVEGTSVIRFLLGDPAFPRSARHNIEQLERIVATLPRSDRPRQACAHARAVLSSRWAELSGEDPALLRSALDTMQIAIAAVSDAVVATYVQAME
jgi:uncharacterized alpha-E superfamily protein